jgi:hypothetical protein
VSSDDASEDEFRNADFFESSVFWTHEQARIKRGKPKKTLLDENSFLIKRKKNVINTISQHYYSQRQTRKHQDWKHIKPQMESQYHGNYNNVMFENPVTESYLTSYMEET